MAAWTHYTGHGVNPELLEELPSSKSFPSAPSSPDMMDNQATNGSSTNCTDDTNLHSAVSLSKISTDSSSCAASPFPPEHPIIIEADIVIPPNNGQEEDNLSNKHDTEGNDGDEMLASNVVKHDDGNVEDQIDEEMSKIRSMQCERN